MIFWLDPDMTLFPRALLRAQGVLSSSRGPAGPPFGASLGLQFQPLLSSRPGWHQGHLLGEA